MWHSAPLLTAASKHLLLSFCLITAKSMQCHLLDFGCCHVCMCMCFFANWVLHMGALLSSKKFRNYFPASFISPSPNGPLTSPHRSLSPLLNLTQALMSPSMTYDSSGGISSKAFWRSSKNPFFTLLACYKHWCIT